MTDLKVVVGNLYLVIYGISNSSTSSLQLEFCYHQCNKCGMIYDCDKDFCKLPFSHDRCQICKKGFFYFNPSFYQ
jgi:hypothetical protein